MTFKVGDKVRCLDPPFKNIFSKGKVYIVTECYKDLSASGVLTEYITIQGSSTGWYARMFTKSKERNLPNWF